MRVVTEWDVRAAQALARRLESCGPGATRASPPGLTLWVRHGRQLAVHPSWRGLASLYGLLGWLAQAHVLPVSPWPVPVPWGPALVIEVPPFSEDLTWVDPLAALLCLWRWGRDDRIRTLFDQERRGEEGGTVMPTEHLPDRSGSPAPVPDGPNRPAPQVLGVTVVRQGIRKPHPQSGRVVVNPPPSPPRRPGG